MYVLRCCALGVTSRMSCWLLSSAGRRNSNTFLHPLEKVQKTSQPEASMNEWLGRSVPISNLLLCMYIYIHIIFYVCIRIVCTRMFFILVSYSVFRKLEKCCTETQTVVLLFSSKDQLKKLKRQGWTFGMYILKLTYVYNTLFVYSCMQYSDLLGCQLENFRCTHWHWKMIEGTVAPKTWVFVEHRLCQAMRMLNQHQGLVWFRSHQNYIPSSSSVLSCLLWYTARISIIFIFLYHIIIYITDPNLLAIIRLCNESLTHLENVPSFGSELAWVGNDWHDWGPADRRRWFEQWCG